MASGWSVYGNYIDLSVIEGSDPTNYIHGLLSALNERMDSVVVEDGFGYVIRFSYVPITGGRIYKWVLPKKGDVWYNDNMKTEVLTNSPAIVNGIPVDSGETTPATISYDILTNIRSCISQLCGWYINYKAVGYDLSGVWARNSWAANNNPWNWTFNELLEEVKDDYPYYRNKYPTVGELPHPKATAEHIQLYYYMINKLKTAMITYGNQSIGKNMAPPNKVIFKPNTANYPTYGEAYNELINSSWQETDTGTTFPAHNFEILSQKVTGLYSIRDIWFKSFYCQTLTTQKVLVDTYVQPARMDFPFYGMSTINILYRMRQDLEIQGSTPFDGFVREQYDIQIPTPDPGTLKRASNSTFILGGDPNHINIGTIFYTFRDYVSK